PTPELLHHAARFLLGTLAQEPAELLRRDACRIEKRAEMMRHDFISAQVAGRRDARELPQEQVDRNVAEPQIAAPAARWREHIGDAVQKTRAEPAQHFRRAVPGG